uniref:Uncharacterized protein n=1 Tax=Solanum lycopersicum TaxID=4081 RepID=A0A3Q7JPK2_SOLLC
MPNFFVDVCQDLIYAAGWPSRPVRPIFKVKRAPKRAYPSFRQFSCAIANHFLGDPDFDVKNTKLFCGGGSSLAMHPVGPLGQSDQFSRSKKPRSAHTPNFDDFSCAIANHFLGYPDSDVKNAKFYYGCPSRPCLCIRLALTASPTNLKVRRAPK